jgi:hypothetical protein
MSDYRMVSFWRGGVGYKPIFAVSGYLAKKSDI